MINNQYQAIENKMGISEFNLMLMMGGWPDIIANKISSYKDIVKGYINSFIKLQNYTQYKFNILGVVIKNILCSVARLTGSQLKYSTIHKDINKKTSLDTIKKYINVLYVLDFIFSISVWNNTNIRSKYKIRTIPKTYLCDTSILCNLLKINSHSILEQDLNTIGIIF